MTTRSQAIAATLTKAILDHRLAPGSKLGERELAEIFDVSRIVVRQALIRVADDGLAQIERHRGAFVAKPSMQEALEIYEAQIVVEQGVAAQLADRLGPAGWAELRHHVERQRMAIETDNSALADELGQEFHTLMVRLSRNRVMQDIHAQLLRRATLLRSLVRGDFNYCSLFDHHVKLIDYLERGRIKQAMELIDIHLREVARAYIMDDPTFPRFSVREALEPYLTGKAPDAAEASPKSGNGSTQPGGRPNPIH